MHKFRNISLKNKITSIIMLTSSFVLVIASVSFLLNDILSLRHVMIGNISTASKVIGNNITAALAFESKSTAEEILAGLSAEPHVIAAYVHRQDGTHFASYLNDEFSVNTSSKQTDTAYHALKHKELISSYLKDPGETSQAILNNSAFFDDSIDIVQNIILDGEFIGLLHIKYSLQKINSRLKQYAGIGAAILIISLFIGYIISSILQKVISEPILNLTEAIKSITENKKYSVIVEKQTNDEIGILVNSFNKMIYDIQKTTVSMDYFNNIIQSMYDPLIVIATDYTILMVNSAACNFLDYSEAELVGNSVGHVFNTEMLEKEREVNGCIIKGIVNNKETVYTTKKGEEIPVIFSSSLMSDADGDISGYVCVARDITERIKTDQELAEANKQIVDTAHKAGMADIATGILHNLGNVMNSVNSSTEKITQIVRASKVTSLVNANQLLKEHIDHIGEFLSSDDRGRKLPGFYLKLGDILLDENERTAKSIRRIEEKMTTMKGIIETQQEYAKAEFHTEKEELPNIIGDVLRIQKDLIETYGVRVTGDYQKPLRCKVHKYKLVQVLLNLVKNAVESMKGNDLHNKVKELVIETGRVDDGSDFIKVKDNGSGIPPENLVKIFNHGFTTKEKGHGFGLHASANSMTEMGGSLIAESDGENKGAAFMVKLPVDEEKMDEGGLHEVH